MSAIRDNKIADAPAGRGAIDDGALATDATRWKFGRSSWWLDRDRARSSVPRAPAPHSALPSPHATLSWEKSRFLNPSCRTKTEWRRSPRVVFGGSCVEEDSNRLKSFSG